MPDYPCSKPVREDYTLLIPAAGCLRFNSKFESGNLRRAVKVTDGEYQLVLEFDTETRAHTQWYYFSVQNQAAGQTVTFSIVNLGKKLSLYTKGLKPLIYSVVKAGKTGTGWHRGGTGVRYERSLWEEKNGESKYQQLSFAYTFEYADDTVYFAHCYPYTYTELKRELALTGTVSDILRIDVLCETLAHNSCPILTITDHIQTYTPWASDYSNIHKSAAGRKVARLRETRSKKTSEGSDQPGRPDTSR